MPQRRSFGPLVTAWLVAACLAGCHGMPRRHVTHAPVIEEMPRELAKVALPPYVIESPDILLIDAIRVIPLPPYRIEPLDQLLVQAADVFAAEPINGVFAVEPDGTINLGPAYGNVRVADMTVDEARTAVETHLRTVAKNARASISLAQSRAIQQVRGEHLVRPDGTVGLGTYGSVYVTGLTIPEAKAEIEKHLSQYLYRPEIALDVFAFNSKFYYVITDGAGSGEGVFRFPVTGNETVLDALSQIQGLPPVASKHRIWVARPAPAGCPDQVLPVDWNAIAKGASTSTNYQLLPGDRVYVQAQPIITLDNTLAKIVSPIERLFGVTLLATSTVSATQNLGLRGGGAGVFIPAGGAGIVAP